MPHRPCEKPPDRADAVAHALIRTLKSLRSARHGMPRLHPAVDPLSYPVLFTLLSGPLRVSDLASAVHEDLSATSRKASTLTRHGLIDKVPDPADGRAFLLSLSPSGQDLLTRVGSERARLFTELLSDWTEEEVTTFTRGLDRLTQALTERAHTTTSEAPR